MRIRWSSPARRDLVHLVEFLAAKNPQAARETGDRIRHAVRNLAEFPQLGRIVPEVGSSLLREKLVPPYRVIYTITFDIVIIAVRDARRPLHLK